MKTTKSPILWDMPVLQNGEIKASRPDIDINDKKLKEGDECLVTSQFQLSNNSIKFTEKFEDLETARMWDMKTETLPMIFVALTVANNLKKGLDKVTNRIPGNIYNNQ